MEDQLTITLELEITDSNDEFVLKDILLIVQNRDILSLVEYWGHNQFHKDKVSERLLMKMHDVSRSLLKANAHLRNYRRIEKALMDDVKQDSSIKGTRVDMLFNKVDLNVEIEGFLTYFKATLDNLTQSLMPIYGLEAKTWGEGKCKADGKKYSGQKLINVLLNLPSNLKPHADPLITLIEDDKEYISSVVKLRNDAVHFGKIRSIQGYRYSVKDNTFHYPLIKVNETDVMNVSAYLEQNMTYLMRYCQHAVATVLSNLLPDMVICKADDGSWVWCSKK